jgi:hypothetical protein
VPLKVRSCCKKVVLPRVTAGEARNDGAVLDVSVRVMRDVSGVVCASNVDSSRMQISSFNSATTEMTSVRTPGFECAFRTESEDEGSVGEESTEDGERVTGGGRMGWEDGDDGDTDDVGDSMCCAVLSSVVVFPFP